MIFSTTKLENKILFGVPLRAKNIYYKVEHPVFSEDQNGNPQISYIDQFPEPKKYGARIVFYKNYQIL